MPVLRLRQGRRRNDDDMTVVGTDALPSQEMGNATVMSDEVSGIRFSGLVSRGCQPGQRT